MIALAFLPIIFYFIKKGVEENKFIYYLLAGFMLGLQSLVCMYQVTFYTAACMTANFLLEQVLIMNFLPPGHFILWRLLFIFIRNFLDFLNRPIGEKVNSGCIMTTSA